MSIYRELDPMPEHRTQFAIKSKSQGKHTKSGKTQNTWYCQQHR